MTDTRAQEIAGKLTKAQREALADWKWKAWVRIRGDIAVLLPTGLLDIQRFPMRPCGIRKARLNETGLEVRRILQETRHD